LKKKAYGMEFDWCSFALVLMEVTTKHLLYHNKEEAHDVLGSIQERLSEKIIGHLNTYSNVGLGLTHLLGIVLPRMLDIRTEAALINLDGMQQVTQQILSSIPCFHLIHGADSMYLVPDQRGVTTARQLAAAMYSVDINDVALFMLQKPKPGNGSDSDSPVLVQVSDQDFLRAEVFSEAAPLFVSTGAVTLASLELLARLFDRPIDSSAMPHKTDLTFESRMLFKNAMCRADLRWEALGRAFAGNAARAGIMAAALSRFEELRVFTAKLQNMNAEQLQRLESCLALLEKFQDESYAVLKMYAVGDTVGSFVTQPSRNEVTYSLAQRHKNTAASAEQIFAPDAVARFVDTCSVKFPAASSAAVENMKKTMAQLNELVSDRAGQRSSRSVLTCIDTVNEQSVSCATPLFKAIAAASTVVAQASPGALVQAEECFASSSDLSVELERECSSVEAELAQAKRDMVLVASTEGADEYDFVPSVDPGVQDGSESPNVVLNLRSAMLSTCGSAGQSVSIPRGVVAPMVVAPDAAAAAPAPDGGGDAQALAAPVLAVPLVHPMVDSDVEANAGEKVFAASNAVGCSTFSEAALYSVGGQSTPAAMSRPVPAELSITEAQLQAQLDVARADANKFRSLYLIAAREGSHSATLSAANQVIARLENQLSTEQQRCASLQAELTGSLAETQALAV
jgi:hypothetical protein